MYALVTQSINYLSLKFKFQLFSLLFYHPFFHSFFPSFFSTPFLLFPFSFSLSLCSWLETSGGPRLEAVSYPYCFR